MPSPDCGVCNALLGILGKIEKCMNTLMLRLISYQLQLTDFYEEQKAELDQTDGPLASGLYPKEHILKFQSEDF